MARPGFDTHFVTHERFHLGRKSMAECGEYVDARDIVRDGNQPTCAECLERITKTAADMFGTEAPGEPVRTEHIDILEGYKPKGTRNASR